MKRTLLVAWAAAAVVAAQTRFTETEKMHFPAARLAPATVDDLAADLDGDGVADVVRRGKLWLNDRRANFSAAPAGWFPELEGRATALACADLDRDGDRDLVVATTAGVELWLNLGIGAFMHAHERLPAAIRATPCLAIALADVDGDLDPDLVLAPTGGGLGIVSNSGNAFFTAAAAQPPAVAFATALVAGDVDGDGDLDLATAHGFGSGWTIEWWRNGGGGVFAPAGAITAAVGRATALRLVDVDGDLDLDLLVGTDAYGVTIRVNLGQWLFAPQDWRLPQSPSGSVHAITPGDFDRDGHPDLLVAVTGQSALWRNDQSGVFFAHPNLPAGFLAASIGGHFADFDGDQDPDVLLSGATRSSLFLNDGHGGLVEATRRWAPDAPDWSHALALGDVDGDGDPDVVSSGGGARTIALWHNDGKGHLLASGSGSPGTSGWLPAGLSLVLFDLDRDGDLDLAYLGTNGQPFLRVNDGSGNFRDVSSRLPAPPQQSRRLHAFDADGDGYPDLVLSCNTNLPNVAVLWRNDRMGGFTDVTAACLPQYRATADAVATADIDRDGDLDLAIATSLGLQLWSNDGSGRFLDVSAARLPAMAPGDAIPAFGDLDGDQRADLVIGWRSGAVTQTSILHNDGTRFVAQQAGVPDDPDWSSDVTVGDVDQDGDLDLVLAKVNRAPRFPSSRIWLNDGLGRFTPAAAAPGGAHEVVRLVDLDADGDLDLVGIASEPDGRGLTVAMNLHRHLQATALARLGHPYPLVLHADAGRTGLPQTAIVAIGLREKPTPIPGLGTLGLDPQLMTTLPVVQIPELGGTVTLPLALPGDRALLGMTLCAQALFAAPMRLSNVVADRIVS